MGGAEAVSLSLGAATLLRLCPAAAGCTFLGFGHANISLCAGRCHRCRWLIPRHPLRCWGSVIALWRHQPAATDWGVTQTLFHSIPPSFGGWGFGAWAALCRQCGGKQSFASLLQLLQTRLKWRTIGSAVEMLAQFSTYWFQTTRLETRAKESLKCASVMVANQDTQRKWRQVKLLWWEAVPPVGTAAPSINQDGRRPPVAWKIGIRVYLKGPERWWSIGGHDEVRRKSDGGR